MLYSNNNERSTIKPQNMDSHKGDADGKMQVHTKV